MTAPTSATISARDRAVAEQRVASNPAVSAFVAASAGSGKTKLLTDRLLRLMLTGAEPARIQCLTFTKAAAAEMALRLQRTLGEWVTLPDTALDAALTALQIPPNDQNRAAARALFARVLDLPGGMRIGTIHAFCQSLLRRFPLEARLSPHFQLVDDIEARLALREAREDMLARAELDRMEALATLAGVVSALQFGELIARLDTQREAFAGALQGGVAALRARLAAELAAPADHAALMARAVAWPAEGPVRDTARLMLAHGSDTSKKLAEAMLDWLGRHTAERAARWDDWETLFFTQAGKSASIDRLVSATVEKRQPGSRDIIAAEQARVRALQEARHAGAALDITTALATLAAPVIDAYAARKTQAARLDYNDLISASQKLLIDPGAAWVLYKLDGGLDHLLLDEVQDTAPAQWQIAGALTAEFFAGQGARDGKRTVFAVGDRKQSIYSFQGADPDAFEHWRSVLRGRVQDAGAEWRDVTLDVSFRSTVPVLSLVDAVFARPEAAAGVVAPGETLRHFADRAGHAGSVELWPLTPPPDLQPAVPWEVPDRNMGARSALQQLAATLAGWIARQTDGAVMLQSRGRALRAGDVLVLVRRRNEFSRALVRALKARGVPVAGLDRMVLTEQPAVADLLALCDTLLLPEDDLQLACVLTSPLGGVSDDSLMDLAAGRHGSLWDALRGRASEQAEWRAAADMIAALLNRVDYAAPHALLAEALGPLGGRARLLARLGPEAAEPIDELLNAALDYAQSHPPSLQGFVQWLRQSGAEVKREAEGAGDQVRIMTVHGAKGLQAPLVILPDTTALPPDEGALLWTEDEHGKLPVWVPRKDFASDATKALRAAAAQRRTEEHNRLLYVALTRAEDRLLVCGWQPRSAPPEACWYNLVRAGFEGLAAEAAPFTVGDTQPWDGAVLRVEAPQTRLPEVKAVAADSAAAAHLPDWAGAAPAWQAAPPPAEPPLPQPLAPSRPQDAEFGPVPQAASPLSAPLDAARFRRGQLAHALLQHLPALPEATRLEAARRYLARPGHGLDTDAAGALAAEVLAVLDHPDLSGLFGPHGRAEVPLTGVIAGRVVGGLVDRLAVLPDRVLIADYKTNRAAPATAAQVPVQYLRQMAAYRAVLQAIYPDRPVICLLIWTRGARVMPLHAELLNRHAPGAEQPA